MNDDLISRQTLIDAFEEEFYTMYSDDYNYMIKFFKNLPSAKPTLYGYKIEHLAYIATVMKKEGVTAEYAVRTFDDMERVVKMLMEEAQAKVEEAFNG